MASFHNNATGFSSSSSLWQRRRSRRCSRCTESIQQRLQQPQVSPYFQNNYPTNSRASSSIYSQANGEVCQICGAYLSSAALPRIEMPQQYSNAASYLNYHHIPHNYGMQAPHPIAYHNHNEQVWDEDMVEVSSVSSSEDSARFSEDSGSSSEDEEALKAGFECLRRALPTLPVSTPSDRMSILEGAINKINSMTDILNQHDDSGLSSNLSPTESTIFRF